jgi:hypothetical protein
MEPSTIIVGVPVLDARVLLAGDHTVWDPGGGDAGAELWTHLRLLFCHAVWYLRCCRVAHHGQVFTAAAVVPFDCFQDAAFLVRSSQAL